MSQKRVPLSWFYVTYDGDDFISFLMALINETPYFVLVVLLFQIILTLVQLCNNEVTTYVTWFWKVYPRRLNLWLFQLFFGIFMNEYIAKLLKSLFEQSRPTWGHSDRFGEGGMPSSHAQFSSFLLFMILFEMPFSFKYSSILFLASVIISYSRYIYIGTSIFSYIR